MGEGNALLKVSEDEEEIEDEGGQFGPLPSKALGTELGPRPERVVFAREARALRLTRIFFFLVFCPLPVASLPVSSLPVASLPVSSWPVFVEVADKVETVARSSTGELGASHPSHPK